MQDGQNYYSEFFTALIGAALTWIGRWLFDRHKEHRDVQKSEVELSEQVATLWRETSKELEGKVREMRAEMDGVLNEMERLKSENRGLKTENGRLKTKVENLTNRLQKFENTHAE